MPGEPLPERCHQGQDLRSSRCGLVGHADTDAELLSFDHLLEDHTFARHDMQGIWHERNPLTLGNQAKQDMVVSRFRDPTNRCFEEIQA